MDKFIAWKIQKDCEINPHGPFCPKTLEKKSCRKNSSSSSSSSSEENSVQENQELAPVNENKRTEIIGHSSGWLVKAAEQYGELSREAAERKRYEEFVKNPGSQRTIKVFSGTIGHQVGQTF